MTGFSPQSVLFVGTRALSVQCLEYLIARIGKERIRGVLTIPKGKRGWWAFEGGPELWQVAEKHGLPLLDESALLGHGHDLLLSVLWEKIFPEEVLNRPPFGAINLHPAPLPEYRGCLTRSHAILNGEKTYGVSMHYMVPRVDEGDLLGVLRFPIATGDTALRLDRRTMLYGYPLFCQTWLRLEDGSAVRQCQAEVAEASGIEPLSYRMNSIDGHLRQPGRCLSPSEIDRLYRALSFPPKLTPPAWLEDLAASNGLLDSAQR